MSIAISGDNHLNRNYDDDAFFPAATATAVVGVIVVVFEVVCVSCVFG